MDILLITLLAFVASTVGIVTGFGTSTIMVPVLLGWFPLPVTLLVVGVVHWFGNVWKMTFFREGLDWRLVVTFGIPGVVLTWIGAELVFAVPERTLSLILGAVLVAYTLVLFFKPAFQFRRTQWTAALGGGLSGFMAGIFGIGGAVRAAFLSAFNLPKAVYIATAGAIGLVVDSARLVSYVRGGATLGGLPLWALVVFVAASLVGAYVARRIVGRIPQSAFRTVVAVFLFVVAVRLVVS